MDTQKTTKNYSGMLGGIISGIGSLAGNYFGYKGQKEANKTNLKLAEQARQHDIAMWNAQNAYNTPAMQMQRMKEAGLNPNLVYGSGAGQTTASAPPKAPVPQVDNELASLAQMSLTPMISLYQDWQVKKAQIDNLQAETRSKQTMNMLNSLKVLQEQERKPYYSVNAINEAELRQHKASIGKYQNVSAWQKSLYDREAYPALIRQITLRNAVLEQSKIGQQLENDLSRNLKPYGLTSRDNVWARLLLNLGNNPKIKPILNSLIR